VELNYLQDQGMAQKLEECYCDEDVGSEVLSCHPHPWTGIQMLSLMLKETMMTENKDDCQVLL
jgi:hypothetical protein